MTVPPRPVLAAVLALSLVAVGAPAAGSASAQAADADPGPLFTIHLAGLGEPAELAQASAGGDPLRDSQWGLDALRAEDAWAQQDAAGVTIAVIDSGVDGAHEDLAGIVLPGFDAVAGAGPGNTDQNFHGTAVAGVAGAIVGNGVGMAGMGLDARILPVRVMAGGTATAPDVAAGIRWAADNGADVINVSLGSPSPSPVVADAIRHARVRGALVVASSGNDAEDGNPAIYPAAQPETIAVGSIARSEGASPFVRSSFSTYGPWIDLVAPGSRITSTCPVGTAMGFGNMIVACADGYHGAFSGTSFAAPFVSAAAAMVKARHPRATPSQVAWRLTATATDLGPTGHDPEFGHGLVDPHAAVTAFPDAGCRASAHGSAPRTWDVGRVETAIAAACTHWPAGGAPTVVLATGADFPDALAGGALAAAHDAPLLLTHPQRLPLALAEMLVQLGTERVLLLGGHAAVSPEVEQALHEIGVSDVQRISGADRYATAAEAAGMAVGGSSADEVVVASGMAFPDAVSAGALLGAGDPPVLLTRPDRLPQHTLDAIAALGATSALLVGGTAAVSPAVEAQLSELLEVRRLSGADRYATSVAVAAETAQRMAGSGPLLAASGATFPDALAAGALSARLGGGLVLVPPGALADDHAVAVFAEQTRDRWTRAEVVGGTAAVSEAVRTRLGSLVAP